MITRHGKPAGVRARFRRTRMTAAEEAARAGIDLSLIEVSLGYSYDKRAEQHQAALDLALELERIGRELRDVILLQDLIPAKAALSRDKDLFAVKEQRAITEKQK